MLLRSIFCLCAYVSFSATLCLAQLGDYIDLEKPPFSYEATTDDNAITRLIGRLENKELELSYDRANGYLESLLEALNVPISSQVLVFSKTSLQVQHISRWNPRAIYFNDDIYVGWVKGSSLMELSVADPNLGAAFYTVEMSQWRAHIKRQNYDCLGCHATTLTQGIPGHTMRSVFPKTDGSIDVQKESFVTSDTSRWSERFGGWYVTGTHGAQTHMGNTVMQASRFDAKEHTNVTDLDPFFDSSDYMSNHSDIVALLVLGHQTQMHNTLTRANFRVRKWRHELAEKPATDQSHSDFHQALQDVAKEVVAALLFCGEPRLDSSVSGTSSFADEFAMRGPFDEEGRSLRELDLQTRLFKYPCSYLIYSQAFQQLDPELRELILVELHAVLTDTESDEKYAHLTSHYRVAILEILQATMHELPACFR